MKLGLFGLNMGPCAEPGYLREVVIAAEQAGFESAWTGEHVALPDPQQPPSPLPPEFPLLDSVAAIGFVAAATSVLRIGTGVLILPLHNPLMIAKQLASLDVLSGGRVLVGIGVGYIASEFEALGINFADRGRITDDYLAAMNSVWYDEKPRHDGAFSKFSNIASLPRPIRRPMPLLIGGGSRPAYRRALVTGSGWFGFNLSVESTRAALAEIDSMRDEVARPAHLAELEITVMPSRRPTAADIEAYEQMGVDRIIVWPAPRPDKVEEVIDQLPDLVRSVTKLEVA